MNDVRVQPKKAYETPEITEIGQLNQFIRSNGLSYDVDGGYTDNMMRYATFDPYTGSTP